MNEQGFTILTGATGLLGRYLVRDLAHQGLRLAVLVRPRGKEPAEARVDALVADWDVQFGESLPRPMCLAGDVNEPGLGLSREARAWAEAHCHRLVHSAASLVFFGADRAREPWLSNYAGTINVARFCRSAGIGEFHHISTAYVCGTRQGIIYESELDAGQGFRNDYEHCKFAAEAWLRREAGLDSLTVYRPAVITGDSRTGYTTTYQGPYRFFQFAWLLSQQAVRGPDGRWDLPVRLRLTGHERRNLVPVDWVSAVIARLVTRPGAHGKTFHLTPAVPTRSNQIEQALSDYFRYRGPRFVGPDGAPDSSLSDMERFFYQYISAHEDYLSSEPAFDAANTAAEVPDLPCPVVDVAGLRRLIDFGVRDRWGKGPVKSTRLPDRARQPV